MIKRIRTIGLALAAAAVFATGSAPKPAAANTGTSISTIAGAVAVIGGIVLYNNYQHKQQAANQIVGYTRNGGSILGDGRIVMPNGQTFYPSANGRYSWGQYAYYTNRFDGNAVAYDTNRSGRFDRTHRHDNGLHRGWYKHDQPVHVNAYAPDYRHENKPKEHGRDRDDQDRHDNGNGHGHGHDRD